MLNGKEQFKLDLVMKVLTGKMTRAQARKLLSVSSSTLKRFLKRYRAKGPAFVKHGNCFRTPKNKHASNLKSDVIRLVQDKYFDLNILHLQEKLRDVEKIKLGRETLRKWCHEIGLVKRSKRRRGKPRYYRDRMPQAGLMIQMDGSYHEWFGKRKSCLIATIDDATGQIPYAEFFHSEDTWNCMKVVQRVVEKMGVFQILYTDRAGIFGGTKRQNFSQLKRACEELGIQVVYAYSPEAKGRIERLFQTLQDRLVVELRLRRITRFEEANAFLQNVFIPVYYADRFTHPPQVQESAYQPLLASIDLHEVFCLKDFRRILNDHTISYEAAFYALRAPKNESIANHDVEIREYPNKTWKVFYRGKQIDTQRVYKGLKKLPWYADRPQGSNSPGN